MGGPDYMRCIVVALHDVGGRKRAACLQQLAVSYMFRAAAGL